MSTTTRAIREAWWGIMDDYRQTWRWVQRPSNKPPSGAINVFLSWGFGGLLIVGLVVITQVIRL